MVCRAPGVHYALVCTLPLYEYLISFVKVLSIIRSTVLNVAVTIISYYADTRTLLTPVRFRRTDYCAHSIARSQSTKQFVLVLIIIFTRT